nr:hypothetical protein [Lacticaseibacillus camelliae]
MLDQSVVKPIVALDDHRYIAIIPDAEYNLEVWEKKERPAAPDGPDGLQVSP